VSQTDELKAFFETNGYVLVKGMVGSELLKVGHEYALMRARNNDMQDGDIQVKKTPVVLGDRFMEAIMEHLRPKVEAVTGKELFPTYSCMRVYKNGDDLKRHIDRPACEFSMTLTLGYDTDVNWPILVGDKDSPSVINMEPGDAVIYKGCEIPHWREQFEGTHHAQVFLHYVDANGPYEGCKYDGREGIGTHAS